jgi:hypothetical protein
MAAACLPPQHFFNLVRVEILADPDQLLIVHLFHDRAHDL